MIANEIYKLERVLKFLIFSFMLFFCSQSCQEQNEDTSMGGARPNVILIMSDDQGYGDFGCHGNPYGEEWGAYYVYITPTEEQ